MATKVCPCYRETEISVCRCDRQYRADHNLGDILLPMEATKVCSWSGHTDNDDENPPDIHCIDHLYGEEHNRCLKCNHPNPDDDDTDDENPQTLGDA